MLVLDYYMTEMIVEPYSICIDNLFTGSGLKGNGDTQGFQYFLWVTIILFMNF
jgi:hypothetical protein